MVCLCNSKWYCRTGSPQTSNILLSRIVDIASLIRVYETTVQTIRYRKFRNCFKSVVCWSASLRARGGFARRDVCLRRTLGCHAPFRAVKKNQKPTPPEPALPTPTSSTTTVYPPIYSPGPSIFYSKYRPTPIPPSSNPSSRAKPRQHSITS